MKNLTAIIAFLFLSSVIYCQTTSGTHIPESCQVPIEIDGCAESGEITGAIGWVNPVDGYDWYLYHVLNGDKVTIQVDRTSGDILPNIGVVKGYNPQATEWCDVSGNLMYSTSNNASSSTALEFTPGFTGAVLIYVSTWFNQAGGEYVMTVEGHTIVCPLDQPIPTLNQWGLIILGLCLSILGIITLRNKSTRTIKTA